MYLSIILLLADLGTTIYITSNGGVELNPIPLPFLYALKIVSLIGLTFFIVLAKIWKERVIVPFIFFDIWYAIAVVHNVYSIISHLS